jgi:uroporphyrinogen III methyltransferase / synthase
MSFNRALSLGGRRIVVTRASEQASELVGLLSEYGAEPIEMPVTRIEPLDFAPLRDIIARLGDYSWVVFTSQNGVRIFWDAMTTYGAGSRSLHDMRVVGVGPATASALEERGITLSVHPSRFVAEGVLDAIVSSGSMEGARVLYAAAEGARDVIPKGLEEKGASVDRVDIYRSVPETSGATVMRARIEREEIDLVTYTAGSAVRAFVSAVGADTAKRVGAASIGPVTSEVARGLGLDVVVEAREPTMRELVNAILGYYGVTV